MLIYCTRILGLLLALSLVTFHRRARLEETVLAERFVEEWPRYVAQAKFLIRVIS